MNSRNKGKVGEREFRDVLRDAGFLKSYRGQQYSGTETSADVVCPELPNFHFEVKRVQALNIHDAMEQAQRDCGNKIPIVAHRKNNKPWLVTVPVEVFFQLLCDSLPPQTENNLPASAGKTNEAGQHNEKSQPASTNETKQ